MDIRPGRQEQAQELEQSSAAEANSRGGSRLVDEPADDEGEASHHLGEDQGKQSFVNWVLDDNAMTMNGLNSTLEGQKAECFDLFQE